ncbi:hypothetical protein EH223_08970 [candidate division KSB1 bacterium]|nr:hypothetical protein [candidate division KSB1 bacterium]RQW03738.1 MAG: hypothetical protein EH223_08970 [candidate division KSB1 bacterium]
MWKISILLFTHLVFIHLLSATEITGELQQWHKVTLTFTGPQSSESAEPNPFLDFRRNPQTSEDYSQVQHRWQHVRTNQGEKILIQFNAHSNGKITENSAHAYSRGRWRPHAI